MHSSSTRVITPELLHRIMQKAEASRRGRWRAVGASVMAGSEKVAQCDTPRGGYPEDARRVAAHVAECDPNTVLALCKELLELRHGAIDIGKTMSELNRRVEEAEARLEQQQAVTAAMSLPGTTQAGIAADGLARRIRDIAPEAGQLAEQLAALVKAGER